jgi:hypothetical protein
VRTIPTRTNSHDLDGRSKKPKHARAKSVKRSENANKNPENSKKKILVDPGRHSQCRINVAKNEQILQQTQLLNKIITTVAVQPAFVQQYLITSSKRPGTSRPYDDAKIRSVYDLACGPLSDTEWCSRSDREAVEVLLHVFRSATEFPSLPHDCRALHPTCSVLAGDVGDFGWT